MGKVYIRIIGVRFRFGGKCSFRISVGQFGFGVRVRFGLGLYGLDLGIE